MTKHRNKPQVIQVQDRYITKGSALTLAGFLAVAGPLSYGGWELLKAVAAAQHTLDATQSTIDKHTDLIKQEADDFKSFKVDFKSKVDDDSKQREALRTTFLDNSAKTTQGIADLNIRAAKTETAQDFLNKQVGDVVQQLKTLTDIVARNSTPLTGRR